MSKILQSAAILTCCILGLSIFYPIGVEAAFPGYNGKISYHQKDSGVDQLYLQSFHEYDAVQITEGSDNGFQPRWSPDGTKVAFASSRDGNREIYIYDINSSNVERITDNSYLDSNPNWHPSGTSLIFHSDRDGNLELYTIDLLSRVENRLTMNSGSDFHPSYSPDGKSVVFVSNRDGNNEIYILDLDTSNLARLTNNSNLDLSPSWSPDGKKIAFYSNRSGNHEIYTMNQNGSHQTNITNNLAIDADPTWIPDGSGILFWSDLSGVGRIYLINPDGSDLKQIAFGDSGAQGLPDTQPLLNIQPKVINDATTVSFNGTKSINVLTNDTDEEALDAQYLTIKTHPSYGSASIVDGKVRYTPKKDFVGSDKLTYQICDSFLLDQKCSTGVLSITVQAGPKPPAPKIEKVGAVELNNSNKVYYTSNKPTFSGIAEPFAIVRIEIHSDPIILTTTADAEGNWSVTPDVDIPNGEHTVTITSTKDGAISDPITFTLGINTGLAETGNPLWPVALLGLIGSIAVGEVYLKKRCA